MQTQSIRFEYTCDICCAKTEAWNHDEPLGWIHRPEGDNLLDVCPECQTSEEALYHELVSDLRFLRNKHSEISAKVSLLLSTCPCYRKVPCEQYYESDDPFQSYTKYWDECDVCGKRTNETEKKHSW